MVQAVIILPMFLKYPKILLYELGLGSDCLGPCCARLIQEGGFLRNCVLACPVSIMMIFKLYLTFLV